MADHEGDEIPSANPPVESKYKRDKRIAAMRDNVPDGGFRTGQQWRVYMECLCEAGGRYTAPKREAFFGTDAYEEAAQLHEVRVKSGSFAGRKSTAKRFANLPEGGFHTGEEWMQHMTSVIEAGGRFGPPQDFMFASSDAFARAQEMHKRRSRYGGVGIQTVRREVPKLQVPDGGFESGERWLHDMNALVSVGGRFAPPTEGMFRDAESFQEASFLHQDRLHNGGVGRMSKEEYASHSNEKKRNDYAAEKEDEDGRQRLKAKQKIDDANKALRKAKAISNGMAWCAHGSHSVPEEEMTFDPVVDLELEECLRGRRRHYACIKHFTAYHLLHLRQNKSRVALIEKEKYESRKRGLAWQMSDQKVDELVGAQTCYLCHRGLVCVPSFDRVDPWLDYRDDNVKSTCTDCNYAKGSLTEDEFRACCQRTASYTNTGVRSNLFQPFRRIVRKPVQDGAEVGNEADGVSDDKHASGETSSVRYYTFEGKPWRAKEVLMRKSSSFAMYATGASSRKMTFEITKEAYDQIVSTPCYYCGLWREGSIGMDRKDSRVGYLPDNVVPCCPTCNFMKRSLTVDQFRDLVTCVAAASSSASSSSSSSSSSSTSSTSSSTSSTSSSSCLDLSVGPP